MQLNILPRNAMLALVSYRYVSVCLSDVSNASNQLHGMPWIELFLTQLLLTDTTLCFMTRSSAIGEGLRDALVSIEKS